MLNWGCGICRLPVAEEAAEENNAGVGAVVERKPVDIGPLSSFCIILSSSDEATAGNWKAVPKEFEELPNGVDEDAGADGGATPPLDIAPNENTPGVLPPPKLLPNDGAPNENGETAVAAAGVAAAGGAATVVGVVVVEGALSENRFVPVEEGAPNMN